MKSNSIVQNQKGVALLVAVIIIMMVLSVAAAVLAMAYNVARVTYNSSAGRTLAYYRSQAGIVDAIWRIRNNMSADISGGTNGTIDFRLPSSTADYYIEITDNAGAGQPFINPLGVKIHIGPANTTTGSRQITATANQSNF